MTCSSLSDELQKQVHCSGIGGNQRKEKLGSSLKSLSHLLVWDSFYKSKFIFPHYKSNGHCGKREKYGKE